MLADSYQCFHSDQIFRYFYVCIACVKLCLNSNRGVLIIREKVSFKPDKALILILYFERSVCTQLMCEVAYLDNFA